MGTRQPPKPVQHRGRPVRFFAMLALCWLGVRVATWHSPWPALPMAGLANAARTVIAAVPAPAMRPTERVIPTEARQFKPAAVDRLPRQSGVTAPSKTIGAASALPALTSRTAAGQNLLWMAGMQALPVPAAIADRLAIAQSSPGGAPRPFVPLASGSIVPGQPEKAWHFDGWVQLRRSGTRTATPGTSLAVLGGSQAGAVARFALLDTRLRPEAIARAGFTPPQAGQPAQAELGLGLRVAPLGAIPVIAQVEGRAIHESGRVRFAPVALVAGGIDAVPLVATARLRAYGEAGWIGGRGATAFADGQAAADIPVAAFNRAELDAGVGVWGGVQRGAARLDAGPLLALRAPLAQGSVRLQLDYRVRIAGNAAPSAGPALTLSTGF